MRLRWLQRIVRRSFSRRNVRLRRCASPIHPRSNHLCEVRKRVDRRSLALHERLQVAGETNQSHVHRPWSVDARKLPPARRGTDATAIARGLHPTRTWKVPPLVIDEHILVVGSTCRSTPDRPNPPRIQQMLRNTNNHGASTEVMRGECHPGIQWEDRPWWAGQSPMHEMHKLCRWSIKHQRPVSPPP